MNTPKSLLLPALSSHLLPSVCGRVIVSYTNFFRTESPLQHIIKARSQSSVVPIFVSPRQRTSSRDPHQLLPPATSSSFSERSSCFSSFSLLALGQDWLASKKGLYALHLVYLQNLCRTICFPSWHTPQFLILPGAISDMWTYLEIPVFIYADENRMVKNFLTVPRTSSLSVGFPCLLKKHF